jgi:hypothetical protein
MSPPFTPDKTIPNTTTVFGDAKCFKIRQGNFYMVSGNMYRGTRPEPEHPDNHHTTQPSQVSCFDGTTTFDIDSADFLVIRGHFFDADRAASSTSDPQPTSHAAPGQVDPRSTGERWSDSLVHGAFISATMDRYRSAAVRCPGWR